MTLQGYTGNNLILSTAIGCGSIKIIHTMLQSIVNQFVYQFLIITRQTHHTKT